ncbi:MAG: SseB family protein [Eubacterium sp.]|nr:SseB family protein [Eubacterium sp.]
MEKKFVNEAALNFDGKPMEAAMQAYLNEKSPANMATFMQGLMASRFLVPVEFPKQMSKELVEKLKKGEKVTPQELPRMLPILLRNKQNEHFVPAYTSREQLPKDHNYVAIMPVAFKDVIRVAQVKEYKVKAICLNPQTTNMLLSDKFIAMMDSVCKGEAIADVMEKHGFGKVQSQKITMTVEQFHAFARRNVELGILPKYVFDNKETFVDTLEEKGSQMILDMYKATYRANIPFPYEADDIDVMMLAIRDDLTIVSIGLPAKNVYEGACSSAYVVWNPETKEIQYFVIENAKDKEGCVLGQVTSEGKYQPLGEAPAQGSEMTTILEMFDK